MLPCLGGRAGGPAGEDDHDHGCDADDDSARDVERVVQAKLGVPGVKEKL